jgi:uncharacterized protein
MEYKSMIQQAFRWVLVATLLSFGLAMAQSEPTLNEVYATAQSGKLDQAQVMMQQVLISHPDSAKAHFVQSELYARQGHMDRAREALASAERLAPGLPFAKPESVKALRAQLSARSAPATSSTPVHYATADQSSSSFSWGLPLLLAGGVIALGYFMFRGRKPAPYVQQPVYANQGGLSGPQSFGMASGGVMQPTYGQAPGAGLGGSIMGGIATGLAVGAGVMAAEAIGRSLMGGHDQHPRGSDNYASNDFQPIDSNPDMGGQNFGVTDTSSWDDAGSVDVGGGGGGDWDN